MTMLRYCARTVATFTVAVTLMPAWRTARGWVRIWDFPRGQILLIGAIAQVMMLKWARTRREDHALAAGLATALTYQSCKILPYTPLYPKQVPRSHDHPPDRCVRLLMINVLQSNHRSDLVLQAIQEADADIVCLAETDDWWEKELRPLDGAYKWSRKCPLANTYGMLLYSRLPWRDSETRFLVEPDVPSMKAVVTLRSGHEVVLHALHPKPPLPTRASHGRDAELIVVGREVDREQRPAIVIGDLNDVAWSYTTRLFQRLSHTVDPRVGRGLYSTFHARYFFARYPLDHVFHTRDFTLVDLRRLSYTGSDHFPILLEIAYTPSRKAEMPRPELTDFDPEAVQEIMEEAREDGVLPPTSNNH